MRYKSHTSNCNPENEEELETHNYISLLVAFREASAQHYNSNGGEYKGRMVECVPLDVAAISATKDSLFSQLA
jgi:hypothetical protein